ncbi:MAG: protein kinase [Planctomycetes bacterium]|nr:protein kinase [Planctomycetota bacterium]
MDAPPRVGYIAAMAGSGTYTPPDAKVIGGFEILEKIGQGAMGAVFKARQISLDRIVALKVLPPKIAQDTKFIERFQREARSSARLNHPNIVLGIDVGRDEPTGLWYFAMEFIDGPSLKEVLAKEGKLPETRALKLMLDIARALECAARQNIVHRDIKPDNILLAKTGEAKLADLGLAKKIDDEDDAHLTQSGRAVGTPHYMAPEQVRGEGGAFDIRTDLYAVGATLFHLVTGSTPFQAPTAAAVMAMHLTDAPPKANEVEHVVSEGCARLIARLMEKKPEQRVQTPEKLLEEIESLLNPPKATGKRSAVRSTTTGPRVPIRGLTTGPRTPVSPRGAQPAPLDRGKPSGALIAGAVAGVVLIAGLVLYGIGGGPEHPQAALKKVSDAPALPTLPAPVRPAPLPAVKTAEPLPLKEKLPELPAQPQPVVDKHEEPLAPKPLEPAKPEPVKLEPTKPAFDAVAAQAKYDVFHLAFIDALRRSDAKAAGAKLAEAEKDAQLAAWLAGKEALMLDRKALAWPARIEQGVMDGAKKLADGQPFELKLAQGQSMKVGKGSDFQIGDVKDGTIFVGSKGMSMPVSVAKLHAETRRVLAESALGASGEGLVALAFAELLASESPQRVRASLDKAQAAGAAANELDYVRRELARLEQGLLETAAEAAWKELDKVAAGETWPDAQKKAVVKAVTDFQEQHGATALAKSKAQELERLLVKAAVRGAEVPRDGLALWLRSDAGVTLKDNAVIQWADQSGRNRHAAAKSSGEAPTLVANALNGLPALRFDGKDDFLAVPELKGEMKSFSILWTLKPFSHSDYNQSFSAEGGWGQFVFHTTGDGSVYVGTNVPARISPGDGPGKGTVALNEWQQFAYIFNNGEAALYKNGKQLAKKKLEIAAWTGFRLSGYAGKNTMDAELTEFIVYDRAIGDDERAKIERHLLPAGK